jgi:hypothetical protein
MSTILLEQNVNMVLAGEEHGLRMTDERQFDTHAQTMEGMLSNLFP